MSKIKQILIGIGTFIGGLVLAILGLQKRKIEKQKAEIEDTRKELEKTRKDAERQKEVVETFNEAETKAAQIHEDVKAVEGEYAEQIKEAAQDEKPVEALVDTGNNIIGMFNEL